jgi:nucleoside-diphosphate-sugar epimerase
MRAEETALKHKKCISLRLSSVFGVSNPMKDHLLLNFMVKKAVQENVIELYEPDFFRSFVSLKDLSNLIEAIFSNNHSSLYGQKVNVSDPRLNVTKMQIAKWIQEKTGCEIKETGGSDPDKRNYIINSALLEDFNFSYKSSFPDELIHLIDFFRKSKEVKN